MSVLNKGFSIALYPYVLGVGWSDRFTELNQGAVNLDRISGLLK
ncbi:MAG: hypothetical protein ACYTXA_28095 [Nostoc sp.]